MTYPPSQAGEPTGPNTGGPGPSGTEPPPVSDAVSDAVEYPSIEYQPTPPPGYSLPPQAPPPTYVGSIPPAGSYPPPPAYPGYPPPGAYPPPGGYPPPGPYPPPPGAYPPPGPHPPPGGYGAPPAPYYGYPYGAPGADMAGTNGFATASLVSSLVAIPLSFVCFGFILSIVAIVLGVVALGQVNNTQQKGKELAVGGIVIGVLGLVGMGLIVAAVY